MRLVAILPAAFLAVFASSCAGVPAPTVPPGWIVHQDGSLPPGDSRDRPGQARLQVVVAYGWWLSSHTALRLVTAEGETVFWNPAGDYGLEDSGDLELDFRYGPFPSHAQRVRDLILTPTPDLDEFVRFRWALADTRVEVFEWDLPSEQAARMRDRLINGTGRGDPAGRFTTWTFPPWCIWATGEFLRRFAGPPLQLTGWYFCPHSLAQALAQQHPSRLWVFTKEEPGAGPVAAYHPTAFLPPSSVLPPAQVVLAGPAPDPAWDSSDSDP